MRRQVLENLRPVRDRVIDGARIRPGSRILDVGCGDGMIGFGVLEREPDAFVTFSDISPALLEVCEAIATEAGVRERCEFVLAQAEDLSQVADASFDAVTLRSVLIYVQDKLQAHREFFRVLKTGGRLSYFEPINSVGRSGGRQAAFWGAEAGAVRHLADKVAAVFSAIQGPDDPMLNFTERDLIDFAEDAGFDDLKLSVEITFSRSVPPRRRLTWEQWLGQSGNPKIPSVGEAIEQALTPEERTEFERHLRPRVEAGKGQFRMGLAYLTATKGDI